MRPMKCMHVSPGSTSTSTEVTGFGCTPLRARVRARQHTVRSTRPALAASSGSLSLSLRFGSLPLPSLPSGPFPCASPSLVEEGESGSDAVAATSSSSSRRASLASALRSSARRCAYWISRPRRFRSASVSGLDAFATRSRNASASVSRRLRGFGRTFRVVSSSDLSSSPARRLRLASSPRDAGAERPFEPGGFIQLSPCLCASTPSLCRPQKTGSGRPHTEPRGRIVGRLARGAAATSECMSRCFCVILGRTNSAPRACRRAMSASSSRRFTSDALKLDSLTTPSAS